MLSSPVTHAQLWEPIWSPHHQNVTRLALLHTYSSLHQDAVSSLESCGEEETFIAGGYDGRLFTLSSIQGSEAASPPLQIDERSGRVLAMAFLGSGKKTLAVGSNDHSISIYS